MGVETRRLFRYWLVIDKETRGGRVPISQKAAPDFGSLRERLEEGLGLTILFYATAAVLIVAAGLKTGFALRGLGTAELIVLLAISVPAALLFTVSLTGLICYFVFIPSITHDAHLFTRIHGSHILHPLTTSVVLGLAGLCILVGDMVAWGIWLALLAEYILQTTLIVNRVRREHLLNGLDGTPQGTLFLLLHLVLGTEIITVAAGAKPLAPWRVRDLPEDTWIVDVRTKPEFYWNRLTGAESYPWGAGVAEAAAHRPKDRPVLVTCLSGHRSPTVAVMLRKLGFQTVYNLNWGILYLVLIERGKKGEGPFSLTRPRRDPHRRGEDVRGLSIGYVTLQALILILAPVEHGFRKIHVSQLQQVLGWVLLLAGLAVALASYRSLGKNFRVYAAPRRSGTLVTSGIYGWLRHPMYTGVIILFAGYITLWGSLLSIPFWLAFSALYVIKTVKEEAILASRFPEYEDYRARTWKFIPYVW